MTWDDFHVLRLLATRLLHQFGALYAAAPVQSFAMQLQLHGFTKWSSHFTYWIAAGCSVQMGLRFLWEKDVKEVVGLLATF